MATKTCPRCGNYLWDFKGEHKCYEYKVRKRDESDRDWDEGEDFWEEYWSEDEWLDDVAKKYVEDTYDGTFEPEFINDIIEVKRCPPQKEEYKTFKVTAEISIDFSAEEINSKE